MPLQWRCLVFKNFCLGNMIMRFNAWREGKPKMQCLCGYEEPLCLLFTSIGLVVIYRCGVCNTLMGPYNYYCTVHVLNVNNIMITCVLDLHNEFYAEKIIPTLIKRANFIPCFYMSPSYYVRQHNVKLHFTFLKVALPDFWLHVHFYSFIYFFS